MIKSLRKRHLQLWRLWALLLPIRIISATLARKPVPVSSFVSVQNGKALPVVITEKNLEGNGVQLRGNLSTDTQQLLWMNKEPLPVASATLYLAASPTLPVQSAKYLGRIEGRGDYVFDLPAAK